MITLGIPLEGVAVNELLVEWRWLVSTSFQAKYLTAFGDWIFSLAAGEIYFLDLLEGSLTLVAPSDTCFEKSLESVENRNRWFMTDWLKICHSRGLALGKGECFGWTVHPILGGKFDVDNIQVFDLTVYQCMLGQIFRQLKNKPVDFVISGLVSTPLIRPGVELPL